MSLFQHFFTRVVGIRGSDPTGLNSFVPHLPGEGC